MAFFGSVKSECARRNRLNRNVQEYRTALRASEYWKRAAGQNFVITGGTEDQRNAVLASALREYRGMCPEPIIILNGNRKFEDNVINMAKLNQIGSLTVTSPAYKNYDLFFGVHPAKIRELFETVGQKKGIRDTGMLGDYTDAFLQILSRKYTPCLDSMCALSQRSDEEIAAIGRQQHVDEWNLDIIQNGTEAGRCFRRLLADFETAFCGLQGQNQIHTGYNIAHNSAGSHTYMIWMRSVLQYIFNREISTELSVLISAGKRFILIVNDIALEKEDELADVIVQAKQISGTRVGICSQNAALWSVGSDKKDGILGGAPSMVVLNSGQEDASDMQTVLDRFGSYTHFEPMIGVGESPGLFQLPGGGARNVGMVQFEKPRVTVEDMTSYAAAVREPESGTVELYRSINT